MKINYNFFKCNKKMNNEREWEYKGNSEEQNLNNEIIIKGNKKK